MKQQKYADSTLESIGHLLGYFDSQVLASYRNEPNKYKIENDYFEGKLTIATEFFDELDSEERFDGNVDIRFGYRTLKDGNLAIVAWLPDFKKSKSHIRKWMGFELENPEWTSDYDERFNKWVLRNLEGSWEVENGPLYHLGRIVEVINGCTNEIVNASLFIHKIDETLNYPVAENTHRYQDSHAVLYGYLIDGLNKECISRLANKLGQDIKTISNKKTIQAITDLFPKLNSTPAFLDALNRVSDQRRVAAHGKRPKVEKFDAFSQFTNDLFQCVEALKELRQVIEDNLGVNSEEVNTYHEAKKSLPNIVRPPMSHFSIVNASQMQGKTIEKVEFGFREDFECVHQSEALIIYFTDGSIMGLTSGSNAGNFSNDENGLRPEDFHVSFIVDWVPERPKGM
jgi:hypothetical protein